MKVRYAVLGVVVLLLAAGVAAFAYAWHRAMPALETAQRPSFPAEQIRKGAVLAAVGNCTACHTTPGGQLFAGGLPLPTPFGTIYSTNITPDRDTGIGRYTEAAFARAMRQGVDRQGRHLYPAFPYDHFTKVTDEDNRALYAFLMTRQPVRAEAPANQLRFPLNYRILVAGWKLLFFREGPYQADASQSAAWNRGAYLVEGLGHCGACHTPRNQLGAERRDQRFAGGEAEGWTAYALNANAPAPVPWDQDAFFGYLRRGWHEHHGIARGPMAPVTQNLSMASDEDVRAIATYMATIAGAPSEERKRRAQALLQRSAAKPGGAVTADSQNGQTAGSRSATPAASDASGAAIYAAACATCHESTRPMPFGGMDLRLSTGIHGPTAQNAINVLLNGLPPAEGSRAPIMPSFGAVLNDRQMTDLLVYMRAQLAEKPAWENVEALVRQSRAGQRRASSHPTQSGPAAPSDPSPRGTSW